ncbi:MAG TPA: hypothetical protein ENH20_01255 [Candidatus Pacearchaeota archaeon]|nr:hypothetical protein [Candidatus Pacearchaeota archaeon]
MNITKIEIANKITLKAGAGNYWTEILIDNPVVEYFLIPALIFLIICLGLAILKVSKNKPIFS